MFRLLRAAREILSSHEGAVRWLAAAAEQFADILATEDLLPTSCSSLLEESVEGMIRDMEKNNRRRTEGLSR